MPPKWRISPAASSAQRSISGARSGWALTVGSSTSVRSRSSKNWRWPSAHARASWFMVLTPISGIEGDDSGLGPLTVQDGFGGYCSGPTMLLPGTHRFNLIGGHPVLDFLNTVGSHRLVTPREDLQTPEDLVSWGLQSGWLDPERARAMLVEIQLRPGDARAALTRVRAFRESLYRVFLATCEGAQPAPEPLDALEREVRRGWAERRLVRAADGRMRWTFPESARLDSVLPPLALAAVELLTG